MARPIKPRAIRRTETTAQAEVLTATGHWLPLSQLSDASKDALRQAIRGCGHVLPLPDGPFYWSFTDDTQDEPQDVPDVQPEQPHPVEQQDEQPRNDEQQQQQPRPEPQPQPGETMEDIVSRIAGHLDAVQQDVIDSRMDSMLAELAAKVETLLPVTPQDEVPLRDVVRVIELRRPEHDPVQVDGLFHKSFPTLLRVIAAGKNIYLPGGPGGGKSHHAVEAVKILNAHVDDVDMSRATTTYSLSPQMPESRFWGGRDVNGNHHETPMQVVHRYAMANPHIICAVVLDELDNGNPNQIASFNSAWANGFYYAPNGDKITFGKNMVHIACANTFGTGTTAEFSGRFKLDAATLDRFVYLPWETDEGLETALTHQRLDAEMANVWLDVWRTARANVAAHGLKQFITMRGCLNGADLIANGFPVDEALMFVLGNKLPADQWAKVNPL